MKLKTVRDVSVFYHKDGDGVSIVDRPRWAVILSWIFEHLTCPCCGIKYHIISAFGMKFYCWYSDRWHKVVFYLDSKKKDVIELKFNGKEWGCYLSLIAHGKHDFCWRDECDLPIIEK